MADAPKTATRVIGIDPGLNVTGYGIVVCGADEVKLLEAGVIRTPRSHGENLPERLESLFIELRRVIEEFNPEAMCLEEVYSHANYPRTAILMGHARGVICLAARLAGIPVLSFSAKRVKQSITGNGNASKLQVQRAVQNYFSLHRVPYPPDVADALAVALCYINTLRVVGKGQESEVRSQKSGVRSQESEVGSEKSGVRSQESEVRSEKSGVRSQESEVRSQKTVDRGKLLRAIKPSDASVT